MLSTVVFKFLCDLLSVSLPLTLSLPRKKQVVPKEQGKN
jgi:hypothetical protein